MSEKLKRNDNSATEAAPSPWDSLTEMQKEPEEFKPTSPNRICRYILNDIEMNGNLGALKELIDGSKTKEYRSFGSAEELREAFSDYREELSQVLSHDDKNALLNYTGFDYKYINQVARGYWDYETLGAHTPEKEQEARQKGYDLAEVIKKAPAVGFDFCAYRGTNMGSFRKYGVDSLKDLKKLEGQFYVDGGFASTSLQEGMSYVGMEFDDPLRQKCDIEIRYLISGNEHEGVALLDRDVTCSPNRQEYLLNAYSLGYVSRVEIDEQNVAHMDMVLVPHRMYEE